MGTGIMESLGSKEPARRAFPGARWLLILALSLSSGACRGGGDKAVAALEASDVVAYWSVKEKRGDNNYIRPVVRFRIRNAGQASVDYVQTMAVFRLKGSPNTAWGNAFEYSIAGDPIPPGAASRIITLRSDSTYYSKDEPTKMLQNESWEQVVVDVFFRVGASPWKLATKVEVPKRLGAPGVEKFLQPPDSAPAQEPQTKPKTGVETKRG